MEDLQEWFTYKTIIISAICLTLLGLMKTFKDQIIFVLSVLYMFYIIPTMALFAKISSFKDCHVTIFT